MLTSFEFEKKLNDINKSIAEQDKKFGGTFFGVTERIQHPVHQFGFFKQISKVAGQVKDLFRLKLL